jgi:hypothetical protein
MHAINFRRSFSAMAETAMQLKHKYLFLPSGDLIQEY